MEEKEKNERIDDKDNQIPVINIDSTDENEELISEINNDADITKSKTVKKKLPDSDLEEVNQKYSKWRKKKKLYKILYVVAMTILISIFVGCSVYLIVYFWQAKKIDKQVDQLKEMIVEDDDTSYAASETDTKIDDNGNKIEYVYVDGVKVQKKFVEIYKENSDFVAWIKIDGTEIDYPVMQTMDDEEYYLHRDFDKNYNGNGTLFADTMSDVFKPSDNIIIYGHNMKNGKMFHDIIDYEDEEFYKSHKYIQFDTISENGKYEVIAAFRTEIYDEDYNGFKYYNFFDAQSEEEFTRFVTECQQRTPYTISTSASYGDKLITLSTCAYHADEGRYVVVAKKIE